MKFARVEVKSEIGFRVHNGIRMMRVWPVGLKSDYVLSSVLRRTLCRSENGC